MNKKERVYSYERDIVCLPSSYAGKSKVIAIPHNREELSKAGLVGKICLTSDMTEDEIFAEIRNVFRGPMNGNSLFMFEIMQATGGNSKSLTIPAFSSTFKWSAGTVAPKNSKNPIYILAQELLEVYIQYRNFDIM